MSSNMDPAKLKVVDLRNELATRGLDTKGNKAALVKRLKDALEKEFDKDLPDTSIADTSTEDLDSSQVEEKEEEDNKSDSKSGPDKTKVPEKPKPETKTAEKPKVEKAPEKPKVEVKQEAKAPETKKQPQTPQKSAAPVKLKTPDKPKESPVSVKKESPASVKKESPASVKKESPASVKKESPASVKKESPNDTGADHQNKEQGDEKTSEETKVEDASVKMETDTERVKADDSKKAEESEQKGEKRKRSSDSPERSQRKREKSPVKENEPVIDNDTVQLSWYDSDLHLQIDDKTFLSAKPLTDAVFGYAWAGVRSTHGVKSGKVCYEMKITEEIKWEDDFLKQTEQRKNQKKERNRKHNKKNADTPNTNVKAGEEKSEDKPGEKVKSDGKEATNAKEEKMDTTAEESAEKVDEKKDGTEAKAAEAEPEKKTENCDKEEKKADEHMETDATEEKESKEGETDSKEDKTESADKPAEVVEPIPTHFFRVGWSLPTSSLQLGEEKYSYGYESSGRFVSDKQFAEYGVKFGAGDVVGAFLAIEEDKVTIRYSVNGEVQPVATTIPKSELPEDAVFFPHVLSRNCAFELNLGEKEEPWFAIPAELAGYQYLSKIEEKIAGPVRPENRADCEVLLMCGLPASGKTHWVAEHVAANPDKQFTVLGKTTMLDRMTVSGEPLKSKYKGKWSLLVDRLQKCLNKLVSIAAQRRRNFIIDQTNVFPSAQRRKMRPFEGFKRRAVIIVVADEEQTRRQALQEIVEGKEVPDSTILEMKAAMILPDKGEWIDEVIYAGVEEAEAKEIVKKYNAAGKAAGYGTEKRFKDDRWQNRRNDYRGRGRGGFYNQRYEPRGDRWMGPPRPRGGSGWHRGGGPPAREWRGGNRDYHAPRGSYNQGSYSRGGNVRGREHAPVRGQGAARGQGRGQVWASGANWGNQGGWNQQSYGSGGGYGNQNWGSGTGGNQWKYNNAGGGSNNQQGGYGGGYGGNWNYSGQYGQNWGQK
ncbi:hypothetical protein JTB14_008853 [Gonioctena quinquepunctata]|nr:hypothetical protein JTB14_008853 [Gonioctena quinquepunctata]